MRRTAGATTARHRRWLPTGTGKPRDRCAPAAQRKYACRSRSRQLGETMHYRQGRGAGQICPFVSYLADLGARSSETCARSPFFDPSALVRSPGVRIGQITSWRPERPHRSPRVHRRLARSGRHSTARVSLRCNNGLLGLAATSPGRMRSHGTGMAGVHRCRNASLGQRLSGGCAGAADEGYGTFSSWARQSL